MATDGSDVAVEPTVEQVAVVPKKTKEPKAKKPKTAAKKPKTAASHPTYAEMITDAIVTLKERNGSSQIAIAKFVEEKQKNLPANFRKLLLVNLRKQVASGKITKVKGSFKITAAAPKVATENKPKAVKKPIAAKKAAKPKKSPAKAKATKPKAAAAVAKPKPAVKAKAAAKPKPKPAVKAKAKVSEKPAKAARTSTRTTPGKKAAALKAVVKKAATPKKVAAPKKAKVAKKPVKKAAKN